MHKVIVTCAITGAVHTPSMSPYLPITPDEIAAEAIAAAGAGASVVHLHARDPRDGRPTQDVAVFGQFLPRIAAASDVVINITTGGSAILSIAERLAPALKFEPEVASLNMGTMNLGLYELLGRNKHFKYAWERQYLESTDDVVFKNTFKDIAYVLQSCSGTGTRFELECYDVSHLYTAAHFVDRGLLQAPFLIQTVFGLRGGIGVHYEDVISMKRTADRLFGSSYVWSVLGAGRSQMPIAAQAAAIGGNVRVGLEDSLWETPKVLAKSNADQVQRVRTILEALSLEIATPAEARAILQLKGTSATKIPA